jgi:hypothetical protein
LSASLLITFLSPGIATSIDMHIPCLLSRNVMSDNKLLLLLLLLHLSRHGITHLVLMDVIIPPRRA